MRTSLQSSLGVEVTIQAEWRFPEGQPAYQLPVTASVVPADPQNVAAAIARIEGAMTPAEKPQAEDWLVMLQAARAGGRKSEIGTAVALELYAGALTRYPADVARQACADLAMKPSDATAWFPTLPELMGVCEKLAAPRQAMLAGLRSWSEITEADRRKMQARDLLLNAKEAEDEAFMCKRSNPDRNSELLEFADECRRAATRLQRGGDDGAA